MGAQVVSFLNWSRPAAQPLAADWSQQELAEFYRVEGALIRAGLSIETDRGLSDEGDPWFVFLRAEDGEVVVHFARVDGEYLIAGPAYEQVTRGYDFNLLVRNMIGRHPLVQPQSRDSNVLLHPAAILVAIVGTAFFKTGEAKAMETDKPAQHRKAPAATANAPAPRGTDPTAPYHAYVDANQALTILAGAMFAMEPRWDARTGPLISAAALAAEATAATHRDLASMDFWNTGELKFDGLTAGAAHAAALAQTPALLAVTAMLDVVTEARNANAGQGAAIAMHDFSHAAMSASEGANATPAVYLDIQLRAGALPNVEAVHILREVLSGGFEKVAVVVVDKIPDAIAEIIAHGASFAPGATDAVAPAPTPVTVAPDLPPPAPVEANGDATPPPSTDIPANDTPTVTPPPVAVTPTPPPTPVSPPVDGYRLLVQKVIDYFVDHVPQAQVITSGLEIMFVDPRVYSHAEQFHYLDALTFHFNDGSSISLVGEHSTLYHELS